MHIAYQYLLTYAANLYNSHHDLRGLPKDVIGYFDSHSKDSSKDVLLGYLQSPASS